MMTDTDNLMWVVVVVSVFGTWLNARKDVRCFPIWIATNVCWVAYGVHKQALAMSVLFLIYTGMSIYGWWFWKKEKP